MKQRDIEAMARKILAMPEKSQRNVIDLITRDEDRRDAIDRGDWSSLAMMLALRGLCNLKL